MSARFSLTSSAFEDGAVIPSKYTCDGARDISPPLLVQGVPEGTETLALIMDDPDIPKAVQESLGITAFDHWVVYDIPAHTTKIPEGATVGMAGLNSAGHKGYTGPCPPPQYEPREHRYIFTLYALRGKLRFVSPPTKQQVLDALAPMQIAQAQLIGRYSRK